MRFKTILCVVDFKQSNRDILAAINLCSEIGAHLSVLVIALATPPPIGETLLVADKWMAQREADIAKLKSRVERSARWLPRANCRRMWTASIPSSPPPSKSSAGARTTWI